MFWMTGYSNKRSQSRWEKHKNGKKVSQLKTFLNLSTFSKGMYRYMCSIQSILPSLIWNVRVHILPLNFFFPFIINSLSLFFLFSLCQSYASILYLRLPDGFRIILRGKDVLHHNIINDMMLTKEITYKPLHLPERVPRDLNVKLKIFWILFCFTSSLA